MNFSASTLSATAYVQQKPPKLRHTRLIKCGNDYELHVIRWGDANDIFGDPLPFDEPAPAGSYGKFKPWNQWLGEQLMYAAGKQRLLGLTGDEAMEFVAVANFGARFPNDLKAAAVKHSRSH